MTYPRSLGGSSPSYAWQEKDFIETHKSSGQHFLTLQNLYEIFGFKPGDIPEWSVFNDFTTHEFITKEYLINFFIKKFYKKADSDSRYNLIYKNVVPFYDLTVLGKEFSRGKATAKQAGVKYFD